MLFSLSKQTFENWAKVFNLAGGMALAGVLTFVIFGSAEEQPWNRYDEDHDDDAEKNKVQSNGESGSAAGDGAGEKNQNGTFTQMTRTALDQTADPQVTVRWKSDDVGFYTHQLLSPDGALSHIVLCIDWDMNKGTWEAVWDNCTVPASSDIVSFVA